MVYVVVECHLSRTLRTTRTDIHVPDMHVPDNPNERGSYKEIIFDVTNKMYSLPDSRLTLRRLMSYIYMEHPFLMFLDHTQRRSTVGRTPLDE